MQTDPFLVRVHEILRTCLDQPGSCVRRSAAEMELQMHNLISIPAIIITNNNYQQIQSLVVQGVVTPMGTVSRTAIAVKVFDHLKMALTT